MSNGSDLLTVDGALQRIVDSIEPLESSREGVELRSALGRVLAQAVVSTIDVPSHTNAAMDGFALRGADLDSSGGAQLRIIGEAFAGRPFGGGVGQGEAVRIMTGATVPDGCDTVVMKEVTQQLDEGVTIEAGQRAGQNVRQAGEDLAKGQPALDVGTLLTAADLGLIASLGIGEVAIKARPKVAIFSTGDEICTIGEPCPPGQVYDSNRYTLHGMLSRFGADITDYGVVRDSPDQLRKVVVDASASCDLVLSSGGVSVGEADFVKEVLEDVGTMDFWKIAMKPGRPLTYGRIDNAYYFGLPGNPVAVMVTFYQFVLPALRRLMGSETRRAGRFLARCGETIPKRPGRTEFLRGRIEQSEDGPVVVRAGNQGSGVLRSMSEADCFIILDHHSSTADVGDLVTVEPFHGLV